MQRWIDPWRLEPRPGATSLKTTRDLFVRGLGLVHLIAFVSLWVQIHGLVGSRGLMPAVQVAAVVRERWGWTALFQGPSLYWLWPTDAMLHVLCGAGVIAAVAVIAGFAQGPALLALWLLYLSVYYAGQLFLSYQWDLLLIEATFVALLAAPWRWRAADAPEPAPFAMSLVRLLLLKLMVLSGLVKLASGDPTWREFTALTWHFETQPLPNPVSWYADRLPLVVHKLSAAATLGLEIFLPWALFLGQRGRLAAFVGTSLLMALLALGGNFGFFQLLTVVIALSLLDDALLERARAWVARIAPAPTEVTGTGPSWRAYGVGLIATVWLAVNGLALHATAVGPLNLPRWEQRALMRAWPWRSANSYGLFAVMTTQRPEIVIEGSADGETWKPYAFRYKPGDPDRAPPLVAPHLPRLDWQMWFAALGTCENNPFVGHLMDALLEGRPEVLRLLADDPFRDAPPAQVRATVWRYVFAEPGTDAWWHREGPVAEYCPVRTRP